MSEFILKRTRFSGYLVFLSENEYFNTALKCNKYVEYIGHLKLLSENHSFNFPEKLIELEK